MSQSSQIQCLAKMRKLTSDRDEPEAKLKHILQQSFWSDLDWNQNKNQDYFTPAPLP